MCDLEIYAPSKFDIVEWLEKYLRHEKFPSSLQPADWIYDRPSWVNIEKVPAFPLSQIVESYYKLRQLDKNGNTALHLMVWNKRKCEFGYYWSEREYSYDKSSRDNFTFPCLGCVKKIHRPELVNSLLNLYSYDQDGVFANIFLDRDRLGLTPFALSCGAGCDEIIRLFLTLFDSDRIDSVPLDKFSDPDRNNIFHYLLDSSNYYLRPCRLETLSLLCQKIPHYMELINSKNKIGVTPISMLFKRCCKFCPEKKELVKFLLSKGASPNVSIPNIESSLLRSSVYDRDAELVEILLRAGCEPWLSKIDGKYSPFRSALIQHGWDKKYNRDETASMRVVKLLLAFGVDLQKELYLYTEDERPLEFNSPDLRKELNVSEIDPELLTELQEIRKSNVLLSLQQQCRKVMRRFLKHNADDVIRSLAPSYLPISLKAFLLVENEHLY